MFEFDPAAYGSGWAPFLDTDRNRPLDAGEADPRQQARLADLSLEQAFSGQPLVDLSMGRACLAGVWLLYDFLDASHTFSQSIDTADGSFWHGIMHRREGDYSNAKYWFRRVGQHPIFGDLQAAAAAIAHEAAPGPARAWALAMNAWEPDALIDRCQECVARGAGDTLGGDAALLRAIQQAEWELLFDHCHAAAIGGRAT